MRLPSARLVTAPAILPCSSAAPASTPTIASCSPGSRAIWPRTSSAVWAFPSRPRSLISRAFCLVRSTRRPTLRGTSVEMQSVSDWSLLRYAVCWPFILCSSGAIRARRSNWLPGWKVTGKTVMRAWTSDMFSKVWTGLETLDLISDDNA